MVIQQAQRELHARLSPLYGEREATQIADWVMENITSQKKIERLMNKDVLLSPVQLDIYWQYIAGLATHRPVQYVLHESWFCGMKFYVDEHVLIPRPETEELVDWVAETLLASAGAASHPRTPVGADPVIPASGHPAILDIGTGSGCIAISLKKRLPAALVHACDVSAEALAVARRNATDLGADISFLQLDILDSCQREKLPAYDLIVSNPPYIPLRDKVSMSPHVVNHEPHLALFVKDEDPLVFYKAIACLGMERLSPDGALFAEIHEEQGGPVEAVFRRTGFKNIILKKDMQGKDRMIKATR